MEKNGKKKKVIKTVIISMLIIVLLIFIAPILMIGGPILGEIIFNRPSKPKVKHGEFPFELVYEYNNEQFTVKEAIVCDFEGISFSPEGGNDRDWNCYITDNTEYGQYYLDEEKYPTLYVQVPLAAEYYMGNPDANEEFAQPYLFFIDESTGTTYYEQDLMEQVGARIISRKPSDVLEGNIK